MQGSEDERHIIDITEVRDNISRASVALRLKCSDRGEKKLRGPKRQKQTKSVPQLIGSQRHESLRQ